MDFLYNSKSDPELIQFLVNGDQKAYEAIYRRYASMLFRFARKNISSAEDCEEIVQELFVYLWEHRGSLNIISLKHYLFKAVRYKVLGHIRHSRVKMKYAEHFKFFEKIYDSIGEEERTPEAIHSALLKTVSDLPERCQAAIKLRLLENLSNVEIAQRMDISKKTVEVYMYQAYNHFRASYSKIYDVH